MQPSHPLGLGGIQVCEDSGVVTPGDALVGQIEGIDEAEDVSAEMEQLGEGSAGQPAPQHPREGQPGGVSRTSWWCQAGDHLLHAGGGKAVLSPRGSSLGGNTPPGAQLGL